MRKWAKYTFIGIFFLLLMIVGLLHYATFRFENGTREYVEMMDGTEGIKIQPFVKDEGLPWSIQTGHCNFRQVIVFIHGTPGSFDNFSPYLEGQTLRDSFCLVSYERPGFGLSKMSGSVPHLEGQVEYLDNLLQALNYERPWLAGHSYGCSIAIEYALRHPDRCAGLLLVASPADPIYERYLFLRRILDLPIVSWILPYSMRNSNRELIALKEDLEQQALRLDEIRVPTLIFHGTNDKLVPYQNALFLKESLINAKKIGVRTFEEKGHFILWQESEEISRSMRLFIKDGSG